MRHDHRVAAVVHGAEHIRPEHDAVLHLDGDVPVHAHTVADLARVWGHDLLSLVGRTRRGLSGEEASDMD
jgi:hypothetical protein